MLNMRMHHLVATLGLAAMLGTTSALLARDVAEIELGVAVEMNGDGLAVLRLFKFQILWRSGRLRSRTGKLCNQNGSVHRRNPLMNSAAQNGCPIEG